MLQYKKIDASEGIDVNKTSASNECELSHYWFFKDVGLKFEEHVCNGCHYLLTTAHSLKKYSDIERKKEPLLDIYWWVLVKMKRQKKLNNSVTYDRGVL